MSPPPANASCWPIAVLRGPVAPRRVSDTPPSRPGPAPCAPPASRVLGWRFMNHPGYGGARLSLTLIQAARKLPRPFARTRRSRRVFPAGEPAGDFVWGNLMTRADQMKLFGVLAATALSVWYLYPSYRLYT